jgi:23S rRNA (uracil1939-C5)-methyltransferase
MSKGLSALGELVDLVIDSIAAGGDGIARREDGLVAFVPRTAPGDHVAAYIETGKRFARGRVERVSAPSALRVDPECPHYVKDRCGGCQLQHIGIEAQREAKRGIIRDSFKRIGRREIPLPELRAGASPWRYRHRLSLALRRRPDGSWYAGMHDHRDPTKVFDLHDCLITDERVVSLWKDVLAAADDLPDVAELRGTVRLVGEQGAFTLEGASEWPRAEAFAARLTRFIGVWWAPRTAARRRISRANPGIPAASFSQVNPDVASMLGAHLATRVLEAAPRSVIDAYSGSGDLAALLQEHGIRVAAIELDEEATAYAASRLRSPSRAIAAKVEDVIAQYLPADVVVVNPPRAGMDSRVTSAIEGDSRIRRVFYVSCDPATLARDLSRLPSWHVDEVVAFDMFPQTAHVETVVELTRRAA